MPGTGEIVGGSGADYPGTQNGDLHRQPRNVSVMLCKTAWKIFVFFVKKQWIFLSTRPDGGGSRTSFCALHDSRLGGSAATGNTQVAGGGHGRQKAPRRHA